MRKYVKIIIFEICFLVCFAGISSADTFSEDFSDFVVDTTISGQDGWLILEWEPPYGPGNPDAGIIRQGTIFGESNNEYLELSSDVACNNIVKPFTGYINSDGSIISLDILFTSEEPGMLDIMLMDLDDYKYYFIEIDKYDNYYSVKNPGQIDTGITFQANEEIQLEMEMDFTNERTRMRKNGGDWSDYFVYTDGPSSLDILILTAGDNGSGSYAAIDNISLTNFQPLGGGVPEPSTIILILLGLCGLGWRIRRREHSAGREKIE